jgi:hypothetical protein
MIASPHVGDNSHLAAIKGQALTQQSAPGSLEDGGIDIGMHQHIACAAWATAIAIINLSAIDVDAIGVGHANPELVGS